MGGMPSRRPSEKDGPTKRASRMKRRWRVVLLRNKGEILGQVEAPDVASAKAAAADQFDLDEIQRTGSWCRSLREVVPRGHYIGKRLGDGDVQLFSLLLVVTVTLCACQNPGRFQAPQIEAACVGQC